jgi:hypothetical protein
MSPETIPVDAPTLATDVLLLDHVPPEVAFERVVEADTHSEDAPVMPDGKGLTVTAFVT